MNDRRHRPIGRIDSNAAAQLRNVVCQYAITQVQEGSAAHLNAPADSGAGLVPATGDRQILDVDFLVGAVEAGAQDNGRAPAGGMNLGRHVVAWHAAQGQPLADDQKVFNESARGNLNDVAARGAVDRTLDGGEWAAAGADVQRRSLGDGVQEDEGSSERRTRTRQPTARSKAHGLVLWGPRAVSARGLPPVG